LPDNKHISVKRDTSILEAKDIMTRDVICIHKDTPIFQAIDIMVKNNVAGVPVIGNDKTLV